MLKRFLLGWLCVVLIAGTVQAQQECRVEIDWPAFLRQHDLVWEKLPGRWEEAPYLGNGNIGTMLYMDRRNNSIRLQLFRTDVQDHRDNSYGWTPYSRPRFMIGSFHLKPVGKLQGCQWRLDLWNATLHGSLETDRGTIEFQHLVHTDEMVVYTSLETTEGENGCQWKWQPGRAETTRPGYPRDERGKAKFAKLYGAHYLKTLKPYVANPAVALEKRNGVDVSVQNLLAGGQYAVAWKEVQRAENRRDMVVSIEKSYPEATAADQAVANVKKVLDGNQQQWIEAHQTWWHDYYPASFVTLPDTRLESLYWHQMYKMACATRSDRPMMDTAGPWIQPTPWPYITWDLNVQLCYWPVYPANRLHLGDSLINVLHQNRQTLIDNVRPREWQADSAFVATTSAQDLIEPRDGDMRYYDAVGHLPWAMHNCWLQYRFSMDDELLRTKIFPLLRRSINLYRHLLIEDDDGRLHLPKTYSPETTTVPNCNYDLALLRWGCQALLQAAQRLKIDDPLIPEWKNILDRLVDFPVGKNGFMLGTGAPFNRSHRHYSHLLMAYPLYLVNIDQAEENRALIEKSLKHWIGFPRALAGYSYTGASSLSAAIGNGNDALRYVKGLERYLQPNGLYKEMGPVMETPLSAAQSIHDMLLQSWEATIRVFPAVPDAWQDVTFHDLRTDGAFLVSASRQAGKTQWVRVKSLAGEPCRIKPGFTGPIHVAGLRSFELEELKPGLYTLDIKQGEEAILWTGDQTKTPELLVAPLPAQENRTNTFGLRDKRSQ